MSRFPDKWRHRIMAAGLQMVVMMLAQPALGHVVGQQLEAPAGETAELVFTVEHGCGSSPTVGIAMEVPAGVTGVVPASPEGWNVVLDGGVVRWSGGLLPADQPGDFSISATIPDAEGSTIYFPFVQTCAEGELAWIEIPVEGGSDPRYPAPAVLIVPGSSDPIPTVTSSSTSTTSMSSTTSASSTSTSISGPTTTPQTEAPPESSPTPGRWLLIIAGVVAVTAGTVVVRLRRR